MKGGRGEYHCYRNLGNVSSYYLPLRESQLISVLQVPKSPAAKKKNVWLCFSPGLFDPGALWNIH